MNKIIVSIQLLSYKNKLYRFEIQLNPIHSAILFLIFVSYFSII